MPGAISRTRGGAASAAPLRYAQAVTRGGVQLALGAAIVGLVVLGLLPRTGWYRPVTVLSGSMRPAFAPGDMVVVTPEPLTSVRVGQVISYRIPIGDRHVESHRVTAVVRHGGRVSVRTKGDANSAADPWTADLHGSTAWRVRMVVPKAGRVVFWLRTPAIHRFTVFFAPLLLALLVLAGIWRRPPIDPESGDEVPTTAA